MAEAKSKPAASIAISEDVRVKLIEGCPVTKFGRQGSPHVRTIRLSQNLEFISWRSPWKKADASQVLLKHVERVQPGQRTALFAKYRKSFQEDEHLSLSLIYNDGTGERSFDIIFESEDDYNTWSTALASLVSSLKSNEVNAETKYLKLKWDQADKDKSGNLSKAEITTIIQAMNMDLSQRYVSQMFSLVDSNNNGTLEFNEFCQMMSLLRTRQELVQLWVSICTDNIKSVAHRPLIASAVAASSVSASPHRSSSKSALPSSSSQSDDDGKKLIDVDEETASSLPGATSPRAGSDSIIDPYAYVATVQQIRSFMLKVQGEKLSVDDVTALIRTMRSSSGGASSEEKKDAFSANVVASRSDDDVNLLANSGSNTNSAIVDNMTFKDFSIWMSSGTNDAFNPAKSAQFQPFDKPMSDYWINCSHNTYLEGDQLHSASSVNRYITDLTRGFRCVEIDCWNGDDGEPIVYHGHTLTGKILFRSVIEAVRDYAFSSTRFPLILTLENHCDMRNQENMANHLTRLLGPMLVTYDELDGMVSRNANKVLPSPQDLVNRILIRSKRPSDYVDPTARATRDNDNDDDDKKDEDIDDDDDEEDGEKADEGPVEAKEEPEQDEDKKKKKKKKVDLHPSFARVISLAGSHFKSFDTSSSEEKSLNGSSFEESKIASLTSGKSKKNKASSRQAAEMRWITHNLFQLSRIYPAGIRLDSSNLHPSLPWALGCQLVAMNSQTGDEPMQLNLGLFRANGSTGYILKPDILRNSSLLFNPSGQSGENNEQFVNVSSLILTIRVISAQQLPKPNAAKEGEVIDPYVVMSVHGVDKDNASMRTPTIDNNGFNPVWEQRMDFIVRVPEVAMIHFKVMDSDLNADDFIAATAMPVWCMRAGFRCVMLKAQDGSRRGDFEHAALFIHVGMKPLTAANQEAVENSTTFARSK